MSGSSLPLTLGGRIVALCGVLFLLDTFAPWHRLCVGVLDVEVCRADNAWDTSFSTYAAVLTVALIAEVMAIQMARVQPPDLGQLDWAQARLAVSGLATALVLLQMLVGDGALDRSFGLWAGLVLSAGLTYGNYLRRSERPAAALY